MKLKRTVVTLLAATMATQAFAGCKKQENKEDVKVDESMFFDFSQYKDSDDIPTWTGEKLNLIKWVDVHAPSSGMKKQKVSDTDVVSPEFERVTGISFNTDECFDNGGTSFDSRVAQMIAAKNFPHIAAGVPEIKNLIEIDALWKLDELLPKYAPLYYKMYGPDSPVYGEYWQEQMDSYGGVYELITGGLSALREMDKEGIGELTKEQLTSILGPGPSPYPSIKIRDDILKMLYPEAKSQDEMDALFEKQGYFTLEDMLDVPLDSPQDFIDMLYKIRDLNLTVGDEKVYPIYTHTGSDNWPALSTLSAMFGYGADYFSYWDKETQSVKYTFKEDWFKDMLHEYNKWIRDGVASKEALLDTSAIFKEKVNNGKYALTYDNIDNKNVVGDFKYRTIFARYKINSDKFLTTTYNYIGTKWTLFKSQLTEAQVAQILRAFDFAISNPGAKLTNWGPRSAGLYTEDADGKLQYTDEELAKQATVGGGALVEKYGLFAGTWPGRFHMAPTKFTPRAYYDGDVTYSIALNPAFYDKLEQTKSNAPSIYTTEATASISALNTFWQQRKSFEDSLLKIFASTTDEEFESRYKATVDLAERNGLTDETLKEYNKLFKERINKNYMENLLAS